MKRFEILWTLSKCAIETHSDRSVGKLVLIDLPDAGLPQTFNLLKKKKNAISAKHNKQRWTCISCILTWAPESHFKNSFAFIHLTSSLHRICNLVPTHTWLLCRWGRITYLIYQCHLELLDLEWLFSSILNVIVNIKSDTLKWNFLKESLVPWAVIFVAVSRIKLSC